MILERIDRSGHILDSHILDSDSVSIGRGYHNDLITRDLHVDGSHAAINYDEESNNFLLSDLHSTNGFKLHGKHTTKYRSGESVTLASGDSFTIGKTRYRVLSANHPVPPAHEISGFDSLNTILGHWWALVILSVLTMGLDVLSTYMNMPYTDELFKDSVEAIYILVMAISYGLVWVFVARIQRHDGHFLFHINLILVVIFITQLFDFIEPSISFNAAPLFSSGYFSTLMVSIAFFVVFYSSSYQSTGLTMVRRVMFSLAIPILLFIGVGIQILNKSEFNSSPEYNMVLVPSSLQWRSTETTDEFLVGTNTLYEEATEEAVERHQR